MSCEVSQNMLQLLRTWGVPDRKLAKVTRDTCIVNELAINGDSLPEFVELLAKEFGVDVRNFCAPRYSPPEADYLFPSALCYLIGLKKRTEFRRLPISLIEKSINSGRWIDPNSLE